MSQHPYCGISAAFATKHLKEEVVAPIFASIGIEVMVPQVDTDLLGTFSGEIPRTGSPKEIVLKKAHLGISESGLSYAIASEGTVGPDPMIPFVISDIECMAWVDTKRNIEVVEFYQSLEIVASTITIGKGDSLADFLKSADFPNHSLIAKSESGVGKIYKGINTFESLELAINELLEKGEKLILESDLRANHSPSRQKNIAIVAQRLVDRLKVLCPKCQTPGWGVVGYLYGASCRECRRVEEKSVLGKILGCASCEHKVEMKNDRKFIDPAECSFCNP